MVEPDVAPELARIDEFVELGIDQGKRVDYIVGGEIGQDAKEQFNGECVQP